MAKHFPPPSLQEPEYPLLSPAFLIDNLYCSEDNWEEKEEEEEKEEVESYYCNSNKKKKKKKKQELLEQELYWEEDELSCLFKKQKQNQLYKNLETNKSLMEARHQAIQWMLKVNSHYSFTPLTAVLAVNYLDRFLFNFHLQTQKPWMTQLAAVACLSLAAKMEETQVPLLLDLQVEDCRFVFEAKTIQRMEILILSTLQWRMNSVTPLSFIDYTARRLGFKDYFCWEFLRRCESIILSLISDIRFMPYLPSVIATATMLHVINGIKPCFEAEIENRLLGMLGIEKDKEDNCRKLIMELASVNYGVNQSKKRKFGSIPGSPNGVIGVSFSSDSSNDSWAVALSLSSSPEPPFKENRAMQSATADFLYISR